MMHEHVKSISAPREKEIGRFLKEFQTFNRIITALSSASNLEDIYGIILSSLISAQGLNFSRSILFTFDAKFDTFNGSLSLGPSSREEAVIFNEEMEKEEVALQTIIMNHKDDVTLQPDLEMSCLLGLQAASLWISTVQKFGLQNPITDAVRRISCSAHSKRREEHFLHEVSESNIPRIHNKTDSRIHLPAGLAKILDDVFITIPVRSKAQKYAVVLVDRKFSPLLITREDPYHLQWFANQASLAVENAVLYNNLQSAYNDLKEIDILKSNFLSTISHELRTPLTTIYGFLELLVDGKVGPIPERQRNLLLRAAKNSAHLINMVKDLIDVAELQTYGVTNIKIGPVDPLPLVLTAINRVRKRKDYKPVNINPVIEGDVPRILTEENSLERIIYHILDNAVKFSPNEGKVSIRFLEENEELHISIIDEGIGIQPEHLSRIFDSFYQADAKLSRAFDGMGLGLSITRLLLSATGGKIHAESTPGKGSTFTILYPIAK